MAQIDPRIISQFLSVNASNVRRGREPQARAGRQGG
jgi:hypothetical protein